jgi:hypothetical protein
VFHVGNKRETSRFFYDRQENGPSFLYNVATTQTRKKQLEMVAAAKRLCNIGGVAKRQKRYKLHTNSSDFFRGYARKKSAKTPRLSIRFRGKD